MYCFQYSIANLQQKGKHEYALSVYYSLHHGICNSTCYISTVSAVFDQYDKSVRIAVVVEESGEPCVWLFIVADFCCTRLGAEAEAWEVLGSLVTYHVVSHHFCE